MIDTVLHETGSNLALFGLDSHGRPFRARRVREVRGERDPIEDWQDNEQGERTDARSHLIRAIGAALHDGDHEQARKLQRSLEKLWDSADEDEDEESLEESENLDSQSQGGRGRPEKAYGQYQTGQAGSKSPKGLENMEGRQRRPSSLAYLAGCARLQESRVSRRGLRGWAKSLLD
jgi:hypothetical protein